jgi:uncharacterized membrane protein YeaQ/YmgE (transglycosylase-associated protein family)
MALVWMVVVGLVVGAFARLLFPGRQPGGLMMTLLLGVAGSCVAGYIGRGMGFYDVPGQGPGILASLVGALSLLVVYRTVRSR